VFEQEFVNARGRAVKAPDASTGTKTTINSEGTRDATGKPRATRTAIVTFPPGMEFDYTAAPVCSKAILDSRGPTGCPRGSRLGTGSATAVTGLTSIDPVENDVTAFNKRNGLLFYIKSKPNEPAATLVLEGSLRGRKLTTPVPRLPQPTPFGEAILTEFILEIDPHQSGRGSRRKTFATTGPCRTGRWATKYEARYDDGRGNVTVTDTATCTRPRRR
jgi:hypothetical protein